MVDYITGRSLRPFQILIIRILKSSNVELKLLLGKMEMKIKFNKNTRISTPEEKINIESFWDKSVKESYQKTNRWEKLKQNINEAASEAFGTWRKILRKTIPIRPTSSLSRLRGMYKRIRNTRNTLVRQSKNMN